MTRETRPILYTMKVQPTFIEKIRTTQSTNPLLDRTRAEVLARRAPGSVIHEDGPLRFQNRVCVLAIEELKRKILDEGQNTLHSIHPRGNKLYKDLKQTFWESNMK